MHSIAFQPHVNVFSVTMAKSSTITSHCISACLEYLVILAKFDMEDDIPVITFSERANVGYCDQFSLQFYYFPLFHLFLIVDRMFS